MGCPLSPPCQQKLFARSADYGDKKLETTAILWYTGAMPRRFREYLDRLSRRDTRREERDTYTMDTTIDLNDWQPVRWNATQWFPDGEIPNVEVRAATQQMLENAYNNMTVREYEEMAHRYVTPESMLQLVRLSMPNVVELTEERPMDIPIDAEIARSVSIPANYLHPHSRDIRYEYTPSWSTRTFKWDWGGKGHWEYRRGKIVRIKRYCKI